MSEFDPRGPARVHDQLNDKWFDWDPRWVATYEFKPWSPANPHLVEWDGQLLDGWLPILSS